MFSMIVVSGIRLITTDKLTERNAMMSCSIFRIRPWDCLLPGFFEAFPESIQLIFGEIKTVLPAILDDLNIVLPKEEDSVVDEISHSDIYSERLVKAIIKLNFT